MKILHVITSLRIGGAEKLMVDLLPRLRDLGNEVELAVFYGAQTQFVEQLEQAGITIHKFGNSNVYHLSNLIKLRSFLGKKSSSPKKLSNRSKLFLLGTNIIYIISLSYK